MEVNVKFDELKKIKSPILSSFLSKIQMDSFGNETFLLPIIHEIGKVDSDGGYLNVNDSTLKIRYNSKKYKTRLNVERKPDSITYTLKQKQNDNLDDSKKPCIRIRVTTVTSNADEKSVTLKTVKKNKDTIKLSKSSRLVSFGTENINQYFTKDGSEQSKTIISTSGNISYLAESDNNNDNIVDTIVEFGDKKIVTKEEFFSRITATQARRTTYIYIPNESEFRESFANIDESIKTFDEMSWQDKNLSEYHTDRLKKSKAA